MPDFDTTWERLKHNTEYTCEEADLFLFAAATSLRLNILIFNMNHPFAHDPIAVICPQQLTLVSPTIEAPIIVTYNGVHYEHLLPITDEDVLRTIHLIER